MNVTTGDKIAALIKHYTDLRNFFDQVEGVSTHSPTSSKNAGWVHVEFRNQADPASLLLYVRENSPQALIASLDTDLTLLESLHPSSTSGIPAALYEWVNHRYELIQSKG
jgi:hypothetical protein